MLVVFLVGCGEVENALPDAPPIEIDAPDEPPVRMTLSELRVLPDGPANALVEEVRVTYVRNRNPHLQVDPIGPAIFLFVPQSAPPPGLEVGNTVDLHVTEMGTFEGNREITAAEIVANDGGSFDVRSLAQILMTAPNEDFESELVLVQRGTVVQMAPPNTFIVQLINGTTFELFSPAGAQAGIDCLNTSFDVLSVVTEFMGKHQVVATSPDDFANVNRPMNCP